MSSNLQDLKTELITDPLSRGYAAMTDAQAAADILTKYRSRNRTYLSASEIFEAIDLAQFTALTADQKTQVQAVLNLGDNIQVGPGTKARAFLLNAFPNGATFDALVEAVSENISRAQELFGGEIPGVYGFRTAEEAVNLARALP
jgi:hypothetical protein